MTVYFAKGSGPDIKIGTSRVLSQRIAQQGLMCLAVMPGGEGVEDGIHTLLHRSRKHRNGEWFRPTSQVMNVIRLANEFFGVPDKDGLFVCHRCMGMQDTWRLDMSDSIKDRLISIGRECGLSEEKMWDMTLLQVASLRGAMSLSGTKWTRGELSQMVTEKDGDAALEVIQYLDERGPRVIDWSEDRIPCESCGSLEGHSWQCIDRDNREAEAEGHTAEVDAR